MHQQNCKQQIAKRKLFTSWYNDVMPTGHAVPFSNASIEKNITRLCKANE
jgi:tRNA(Ser,Leu) C12 N-acetylase TAN1